jgi:Cu/Ag efflux pump CusA
LGPDATALGQVFWYTIEGRDKNGNPTGGWDLHEIRTVQDFYVKYGLNATEGVSEVASIGGFVQEYQIDVNPDALKAYDIPLHKVMMAVRNSNRDVGAKTIEINQAEYLVRGLGYIKSVEDIEKAVVAVQENVPIRIQDIGLVSLGPSTRRGALDKDGAEVVGGVVVARYGANPLQVINNVKDKIARNFARTSQKGSPRRNGKPVVHCAILRPFGSHLRNARNAGRGHFTANFNCHSGCYRHGVQPAGFVFDIQFIAHCRADGFYCHALFWC